MALNEDVARLMELIGPNGPDSLLPETDSQADLERALAALRQGHPPEPDEEGIESVDVPLPNGTYIRFYRAPGHPVQPVALFLHGGGWVMGDMNSFDKFCRTMASRSGMIIASLAYRLAPENPFPAALDDTEDAFHWIREHATEFGGDPDRIVVMGSSAGGNLAASFAATHAGEPGLVLQVLIYPTLEPELETESMKRNASGYYLTRRQVKWYWDQYLPDAAARNDPRAAPARAKSLAGLPPAIVVTAEYDPLHDEGKVYAQRLASEGVPVSHFDFTGQIHGFMALVGLVPGVERQLNLVADTIAEAVRSHHPVMA